MAFFRAETTQRTFLTGDFVPYRRDQSLSDITGQPSGLTEYHFSHLLRVKEAVIAQSVWRPDNGTDDREIRVPFPAQVTFFSVFHSIQTGYEAHRAFYTVNSGGSSPGLSSLIVKLTTQHVFMA